MQLLLYLPERVDDPQVTRALATGSDRILHVINLTGPEQVDDQLGQCLSCRMTSILTECALKSNHTCVRLRPTRQGDGPLVVMVSEPCGEPW